MIKQLNQSHQIILTLDVYCLSVNFIPSAGYVAVIKLLQANIPVLTDIKTANILQTVALSLPVQLTFVIFQTKLSSEKLKLVISGAFAVIQSSNLIYF